MRHTPLPAARFRFYAELNDFLPPARREGEFVCEIAGSDSVKDRIESLGVPHTEVELILANGLPVDFSYIVHDGDRVSVYPMFESFDVTSLVRLRPEPLREPKFVLDTHLGTLARYLRMLGFDTLYRNDYEDAHLARISSEQRRTLLTRDRGLLKRSAITHGYCVRASEPRKQMVEIVRRFDLAGQIVPFLRCMPCNGLLRQADKDEIRHRLQPKTNVFYDEFRECSSCGRLYWKGSHFERLKELIEDARTLANA